MLVFTKGVFKMHDRLCILLFIGITEYTNNCIRQNKAVSI